MEGPPIRIHVDQNAVPFRARQCTSIPLHCQKDVEADLLQDVQLGVLERVPKGKPTPKFCFNMVITRKSNGKPRRTIDMSPLNKQSRREMHSTKAPFHLARSVPHNTWKSVLDAWNGFHSQEIHEEDRDLTTFITPIGLFRCVRAPQGFLSSGDGYNRRMDEILAEYERLVRCVDDMCPYDDELEAHWWRIIDLLELLGRAGIVLNPDKFQFAMKEVDFAGFRITENEVKPLEKYLDSVRNFPTPRNITDVRSWFGLVNQATSYAQLRELMEPFRKFLSPKVQFEWDDDLNKRFEESKIAIVEAIQDGVRIFDVGRATALRTDWSKQGIGFYLSQKWCDCERLEIGCCENGWKLTLAGSRFLHDAEKRYCPLEGELLAAAWALEQTRYFTWGCDKLILVTDHQPLEKILRERNLASITNMRVFRLVQRTMPWIFTVVYKPGKTNWVADHLSRYPCSSVAGIQIEDDPELEVAAQFRESTQKLTAMTWERLKCETAKDNNMVELIRLVESGFPDRRDEVPDKFAEYWRIKDALYSVDGVLVYMDRAIVPTSLRNEVLEVLHAANQGVTSMNNLAQTAVYWPGITTDIERTRRACRDCHTIAPSQAKTPPIEPMIPETPFEAVVADYCDVGSSHYLVTGDRLSGWVEIFKIAQGTKMSGSKGLIACLRRWFGTFGVPEELASDGGPEFTSKETQDFLARWGVKHRRSSAYFPQSNGRAEVAVKAAKRALMNNTAPDGSLDTDKMLRALLVIRNTPHQDCKKSPSEIVFNRRLRGVLPYSPFRSADRFNNDDVAETWKEAWDLKERALKSRAIRTMESLSQNCRQLKKLEPGSRVFLQNQVGRNANKWERSGTVMEQCDNDMYQVKVDGTGRVTPRNRRFLRAFDPADITPKSYRPQVTERPAAANLEPAEAPSIVTPSVDQLPEPSAEQPHQNGAHHEDAAHHDNATPDVRDEEKTRTSGVLRRIQDHNTAGTGEAPLLPKRRMDSRR